MSLAEIMDEQIAMQAVEEVTLATRTVAPGQLFKNRGLWDDELPVGKRKAVESEGVKMGEVVRSVEEKGESDEQGEKLPLRIKFDSVIEIEGNDASVSKGDTTVVLENLISSTNELKTTNYNNEAEQVCLQWLVHVGLPTVTKTNNLYSNAWFQNRIWRDGQVDMD
jgi:hypothetical protein